MSLCLDALSAMLQYALLIHHGLKECLVHLFVRGLVLEELVLKKQQDVSNRFACKETPHTKQEEPGAV